VLPSVTINIPNVCDPPSVPTSSATSNSPQPPPSVPPVDRPPLQVYSRRHCCQPPPHDSFQVPSHLSPSVPTTEFDFPIALHKGMCSIGNHSSHYDAWSYHRISPHFYTCLSSISSLSIPKYVGDALAHPGWHQDMLDELSAIKHSGTWDLVRLPSGKFVVCCRWVYAIKVGLDGTIEYLKACLVAKGYTQIISLDYGDTFSLVVKMASVPLFISMAAL